MKTAARTVAVLALLALPVFAANNWGISTSSVSFISLQGAQATNWYALSNGVATAYAGADLGTFTNGLGQALFLHAYEVVVWVDLANVLSCEYFCTVYPTNNPAASNTYALGGAFISNPDIAREKWGRDSAGDPININLTSSRTLGTYAIEIYGRMYATNNLLENGYEYDPSIGASYTAYFTVIPEPAAVAVAGCLLFAVRRRK